MRRTGVFVLQAVLLFATAACIANAQPFAYVTNQYANAISGYTVNPVSGALLPLPASPFPTGKGPLSIRFTPSAKFGYVANSGDNTISGYALDGTNGELAPIAGSPFTTGADPIELAISPSGKYLYTANGSSNLSAFSIDSATGALTAVGGSPFPTGTGPAGLAITPSGDFLYVTVNPTVYSSFVNGYTVNEDGSLTQVSGSPFSTVLVAGPPAFSSGGFLFVPSVPEDSIVVYSVDSSTGALVAVGGANYGPVTSTVAVHTSSGDFLYAPSNPPDFPGVYEFQLGSTGTLTVLPGYGVTAGPDPVFGAATGSGKFLYVADFSGNEISGYSIDPATGLLTAVSGSPFAAGAGPASVALPDPSKAECGAVDVTREVALAPGPYTHRPHSELFDETLTITNGIRPIAGPFSVVLLNVPSSTTTLYGSYSGLSTTYCFSAAGNYVVPIDALLPPVNEGALRANETVTVPFVFRAMEDGKTTKPSGYEPRLITGTLDQ